MFETLLTLQRCNVLTAFLIAINYIYKTKFTRIPYESCFYERFFGFMVSQLDTMLPQTFKDIRVRGPGRVALGLFSSVTTRQNGK